MAEQNPSTSHQDSSDNIAQEPKRRRVRLWVYACVVLLGLVGILIFQPWNTSLLRTNPTSTPDLAISPAQAYADFQKGTYILDVRTQPEWDQYHIDGSTLIPLEQLDGSLGQLPKDQAIVVVCQTGVRSKKGATILKAAGFTNVSYVSGGLQAWIAAGYPVQSSTP